MFLFIPSAPPSRRAERTFAKVGGSRVGSSPASHPTSWPGSMDTCWTCIPPWIITMGYKDSSPTHCLHCLFLSSCWRPLWGFLAPEEEGGVHTWECAPSFAAGALAHWPKAVLLWDFSPGLFSSSHNLILLPEATTAVKPLQSRPPLGPAASAVPAPKQTLHVSPQMLCAQCLGHMAGRENLGSSAVPQEPAPSMCPGQPECNSCCQHTHSPAGHLPPVTTRPGGTLSPEKPPNSWFILKNNWITQLKTCCLSSAFPAGLGSNGHDGSAILVSLCPPRAPPGDFLQTGHQAANVTGGRAPPGRKGIDYQSLFLPGTISLLQFILFNSQPAEGFGVSEGNDTRDYKPITITEPFIW